VHDEAGHARLSRGERGLDASAQLSGAERLAQVFVGAGLKAAGDIAILDAGGEQDDPDAPRRRLGAQAARHLEAVEPRHGDVEQDHVGATVAGHPERRLAVGHLEHLVARALQSGPDEDPYVVVVLGDEDAWWVLSLRLADSTTSLLPDGRGQASDIRPERRAAAPRDGTC
jgi:hypothetical protein